MTTVMMKEPLPPELHWLFWEMDAPAVDAAVDGDTIIPRILQEGRMEDVRWLLRRYGPERIHAFLRNVGHPELSDRTLGFWRAFFHAEAEKWAERPSFRIRFAPWND